MRGNAWPGRMLLALVCSLGVSCGSDSPEAPAEESFCDVVRRVGDLDRETDEALKRGGGWASIQPILLDALSETSRVYARALPVAPTELRDEMAVLDRFTEVSTEQVRRARSAEEFRSAVLSDRSAAVNAGVASQTVDRYTRAECGFSINNEGSP